ncbi:hypothetical protein FKM82_012395 [Ascaphus truei]
MEANQTYLVSERLEREERNQTKVLRQPAGRGISVIAASYQENGSQEEGEAGEEKKEGEEEQAHSLDSCSGREIRNLQEEKERKSECLPAEPLPDHPDGVKIIFKMPNDTRVERRFLFTQSLLVIHDFLFSLKETPEKFQIVANFPRRVLPCLPSDEVPVPPTLQEAGFGRSQLLFVQDLTDE